MTAHASRWDQKNEDESTRLVYPLVSFIHNKLSQLEHIQGLYVKYGSYNE